MTRRLMKHVGFRDGRPVYVTTLCSPAGNRRLMKDTGETRDGRRVFEIAECGGTSVRGLMKKVGARDGRDAYVTSCCGGVTTPCLEAACPGLSWPETLHGLITSTAACFNGKTVTFTFDAPSGGWIGTDLVDACVTGSVHNTDSFALGCGDITFGALDLLMSNTASGSGGYGCSLAYQNIFSATVDSCSPLQITINGLIKTTTGFPLGCPFAAGAWTMVITA